MSGFNSDILWAQGALNPAQRTLYNLMMHEGTCSEAQAMEQLTGKSVLDLANGAKTKFAKDCNEIEALWQKCEKSGNFSEFQADMAKRLSDAIAEDRKSIPLNGDDYYG